MNISILSGRPTKDPDVRYSGEMAIARFTLAVDKMKKGEAEFISCVAFGKTGEVVENYVHKGMKIIVQGHIQTSSYEKDGEKRYKTEVVADRVEFAEDKKKEKPIAEQFEIIDEPLPF
jgi:single-strand DNA-binding protein